MFRPCCLATSSVEPCVIKRCPNQDTRKHTACVDEDKSSFAPTMFRSTTRRIPKDQKAQLCSPDIQNGRDRHGRLSCKHCETSSRRIGSRSASLTVQPIVPADLSMSLMNTSDSEFAVKFRNDLVHCHLCRGHRVNGGHETFDQAELIMHLCQRRHAVGRESE